MRKQGTTTIVIAIFLLAGCASSQIDQTRPISRDLPLSFVDIWEIREGTEQYLKAMEEYKVYRQPELNQYVNTIGFRLTAESKRPHLPYQFIILDENKVDTFSLGGGYIFITRGMLEFVNTEAELAGVLAHEIAHVAAGAHTPQIEKPRTKKQALYGMLKFGAKAGVTAAGGVVGGPAGAVAGSAFGKITQIAPQFHRRFGESEEIEADKRAVACMLKAGYDPREFSRFIDELSKIKIQNVIHFINFLNSHPPYQERREALHTLLKSINFKKKELKINADRYLSIRFMAMQIGTGTLKTKTPRKVMPVPIIERPPVG